ncbi:hypothetical protein [Streptomyces sp. HPF1205]|uniref:hypothetical protein n=1 Tax=Streptomyces sp. HPF1205 TaxID=2873262 RepID=UPI001CED66E5|nr:hypothetical protein [Streptomyces sp. HPF1205]
MPTPHGTRGALAFSADEVRVVRRVLAEALRPGRTAAAAGPACRTVVAPRAPAHTPAHLQAHVLDCLRLAAAVDDALEEAARTRAFLLAELRRYRHALPGTAAGYLERLRAALADGYVPGSADLAALRALRALPCGTAEHQRRTALLRRCEILADHDVRLRLEAHMPAPRRLPTPPPVPALAEPPAEEPGKEPNKEQERPEESPAPEPEEPRPQPHRPRPRPEPGRRTPTPAEIWPPHRRPHHPPKSRSA